MALMSQKILSKWFNSALGEAVQVQEYQLLSKALKNLFGYFIVQLETPYQQAIMNYSRVKHHVKASVYYPTSGERDGSHQLYVQTEQDYLPFASESIDVVLLPHTLEMVDDPYFVLRQVDRMVLPEGHIVVTGFNPYGCLVLKQRWFSRQKAFKESELVRSSKLKEWLEVLGYEVTLQEFSTVTCFVQRSGESLFWRLLERLEKQMVKFGLQFGNVYCLVAKKKVESPTLVGGVWQLPSWESVTAKGGVAATPHRAQPVKTEREIIKTNEQQG